MDIIADFAFFATAYMNRLGFNETDLTLPALNSNDALLCHSFQFASTRTFLVRIY